MKVVTHNERFHADDVFAIAAIKLLESDILVLRTRAKDIIADADIRIDIGMKYDPETLSFDHHQSEGAGSRVNGVPYASFGLVWKHFGNKLCGSMKIAEYIDSKIVQLIDAEDNGVDCISVLFPGMLPCTLPDIVETFVPQNPQTVSEYDNCFPAALDFAVHCLSFEIEGAKELYETALPDIHKAINEAMDPRILVFDKFNRSWRHLVSQESREALYAVYPTLNGTWKMTCIPQTGSKYRNRRRLPAAWAGKEQELAHITNVEDALFCHRQGFLSEARTKIGILRLAALSLSKEYDKYNHT